MACEESRSDQTPAKQQESALSRVNKLPVVGHKDKIDCCIISPDESFILSIDDGKLKAWDVQTAKLLSTVDGAPPLAISPDGSFIVSGYANNILKLWKPKTSHLLRGHTDSVRTCAISPDGSFIVSGSEDMTLKIWDVRTGQCFTTLQGHRGPVNTCAISPDAAFIVSGCSDNTLKLWDTKNGSGVRISFATRRCTFYSRTSLDLLACQWWQWRERLFRRTKRFNLWATHSNSDRSW